MVALSTLSIAFGLRISEAATAAPDEAELHFRGTKGRAGLHRPKVGPWARKWGDFLARLRALSRHHPHRPAFFTSQSHLAAAFLELVQSLGCTCKTIRWQNWRRFTAAKLQARGLPLHLVQIWGGGVEVASGGQDVHYTPPPPIWTFVTGGPMPGRKWHNNRSGWYEVPWSSTAVFSERVRTALPVAPPHGRSSGVSARSQAPKRPRANIIAT